MKKQYITVIDETALLYENITFSAGKIGYQVEMSFEDLCRVVPVGVADVTV